MKIVKELANNYEVLCKLFLVCERKGIPLIVENPYTQPHFLTQYFPLKPSIVHMDRTLYGDVYKKPTQYWFFNIEPKKNFYLENLQSVERKVVSKVKGPDRQVQRSMITSTYANKFIREYILEQK